MGKRKKIREIFRTCLSPRSTDPGERAGALLGCPPEAITATLTHRQFPPSGENNLTTPQLRRTNIWRHSSHKLLPRACDNRWTRLLPVETLPNFRLLNHTFSGKGSWIRFPAQAFFFTWPPFLFFAPFCLFFAADYAAHLARPQLSAPKPISAPQPTTLTTSQRQRKASQAELYCGVYGHTAKERWR